MNPYLKKLSNFRLLYILILLIFILLPIRSAFSGNTMSVDSIQGSSFTLYYDLISMDEDELLFSENPSMSTSISSNPFIIFGNLKGCEFDGAGGLDVLNNAGFSFDVFAISFSKSKITLRSISIPSGSTFTPPQGSSGLVIGHFSWTNPPQDDEINVVAFEASLGSTKIGKRNQRLLKIYTFSQSQSGLSSSATRKKLTKSNASKSNHKKSSTSSPITQQQDEMPYLSYYDLSINAYGGVYVLADLDSSDIPSEVYPIQINFDGLQGGTQPDPSYSIVAVYRGSTLSFNVNASNSSASATQTFALKQLYVPVGAQFTAPSPLKGGDSLSGIFQWPVSGDVEDGTYTAIFGAYLSSGSTSLFPTLLVMNINVQEEPPAIGSDQNSLSFNGTVGGSNPASKTVSISNTGGGTLNWTASKTQPWLTINPASGSSTGSGNPNTITVSVDISSFSSGGTYNDTITIDAPGASNTPQTIPVTLALVAPAIVLNPPSISFNGGAGGTNPSPQIFSVWNSGPAGTTLNWTASKTQSWLTLSSASGSSTGSGNQNQITASVNISGLSPGTYNDTITIADPNASNNSQKVNVTLVLAAPAIGLSLNPQSISFSGAAGGSNPASQTFSVWNGGAAGTVLNWTASKAQNWLTLSSASGSSTGSGNQNQITASVNISGLSAGTFSDTITISDPNASNNSQKVSVTLTLTGPKIGLSSQSLSFTGTVGTNPGNQTVTIWNSGAGGTLNWTAQASTSSGGSWLSINPTSGSSTGSGNQNSATVSINTSGLSAGTYNGTITINATAASNTPQTIPVTLTLSGTAPKIQRSSAELDFSTTAGGSNPDHQTLAIWNSGGGTLNWTASKTKTWLTLSSTSGSSTGSGNQNQITVSVNTSGLSAATYNDTITIIASGASNTPQTVAVVLTLTGGTPPPTSPTIYISSGTLNFSGAQGSTLDPQSLSVSNSGGGTLNWTASKTQTWLTLSSTSGSSTGSGNQNQITVSVNTSGLSAGTYNDTITISDPNATNSPRTVTVSLILTSSTPTIGVNPGSLSFTYYQGGDPPADQTLSVYNAGGGTLRWTASKTQSWLTISPTSTSPITVSVNVSDLAVGSYSDTITIKDNGSTDSGGNLSPAGTKTVPVTLNVNTPAPPSLGIAPDPRSPHNGAISLGWGGMGTAGAVLYIWNKGTGAISWTATANPDGQGRTWLTLTTPTQSASTAVSGTTNSVALESGLPRRDKVKVTYDSSGLQPGTYNTTITVTALGGSVPVPVYLYVVDLSSSGPVLNVYPPTLLFSSNSGSSSSESTQFQIGNLSQGSLNWTATSDQSWLTVSPGSGSLASQGQAYVSAAANFTGMSVGTYDGYIKFDAAGVRGCPYYLHVVLKIHQPGWDFPDATPALQQEFAQSLTITPLETLARRDSNQYGFWPDSGIGGTGVKYYSIDPTSFANTIMTLTTGIAGSDAPANLFIIKRGMTDWQGADGNGVTMEYKLNEALTWDSENERYYVKFQCLSPTGCYYLIYWVSTY